MCAEAAKHVLALPCPLPPTCGLPPVQQMKLAVLNFYTALANSLGNAPSLAPRNGVAGRRRYLSLDSPNSWGSAGQPADGLLGSDVVLERARGRMGLGNSGRTTWESSRTRSSSGRGLTRCDALGSLAIFLDPPHRLLLRVLEQVQVSMDIASLLCNN